MKKVEVYFAQAKVVMNGDRHGKTEDLALQLDWDKPNSISDKRSAAHVISAVKANSVVKPDLTKENADIKRQLFKIQVEGQSLIQVRLMRVRDVTAVEKGLVVVLKSLVGTAATATGVSIIPVVASVLTSFVKATDKVTKTLGVAEILVDEAQLAGKKTIRVDLGVTPEVRKSLESIYWEKKKEPGSVLTSNVIMASAQRFLASKKPNGYVELEFKEMA